MTNDDLRRAVRGRVWLPGEEGFDEAAKAWNLTVHQPVSAVVEAVDADDVAALVRHARRTGRTITAQAGGHGASGDTAGMILLRTRRLDRLDLDPERRLVPGGAGVTWGAVQRAAASHGLTGLPGSAPGISVTGYTLGGGLSWFGRKYGWAADSVNAFEVVDGDGVRVRVDAGSDPDLFWALRGGGGDFRGGDRDRVPPASRTPLVRRADRLASAAGGRGVRRLHDSQSRQDRWGAERYALAALPRRRRRHHRRPRRSGSRAGPRRAADRVGPSVG